MSGVTNEEVLRAINASRDTTTAQIGGLKAAVDHLTQEIQSHHQRLLALEDAVAMVPQHLPAPPQMPSEVRELLTEFRADKARAAAKSQMKLEAEAEEARQAVATESRRKAITWALGALFVASQIVTLWRSLR